MKTQIIQREAFDELPFGSPTDTLKSVLRKKYLTKVAKWLEGKNDGMILAEESNSNWESALTIIFFSDLQKILQDNNEEDEFCEKVPGMCADVARHLIRKKIVLSDGHFCWDKVTWDTAVIVRALLKTLKTYPDKFSDGDRKELMDSVTKATGWLFTRFEQWETEVKYPFGPADVAQILLTAIYFKKNFQKDFQKVLDTQSFKDEDTSIEEKICVYLLKRKEITKKIFNGIEEDIVSWGDFFQTAETLDSLATYYTTLDKKIETQNKLSDEIKITCKQAFRFFEYEQSEDDGMWGTHVDTMRALYAYVKVPKLLYSEAIKIHEEPLDSEPHKVFKALRWICDEKQCFSDGSFLHTMFLTIFMCDALLEVHNNWSLANDPIIKMYDDVVWASPVRTTYERTKRFAAENEKHKLADHLEIVKIELEKKKKQIFSFKTIAILIVIFLIISRMLGLLDYNITWEIKNLQSLIALGAITFALFAWIMKK